MRTDDRPSGLLGSVGMTVEVLVHWPPDEVWRGLTESVGDWWGAPYTLGDAERISLDPQPGGRLLEHWSGGGGAVWGTVTAIRPGAFLEIEGPIGMKGPVVGTVRFDLRAEDGGTRVHVSHDVVGRVDEATRDTYQAGWEDLMGRLKSSSEAAPS